MPSILSEHTIPFGNRLIHLHCRFQGVEDKIPHISAPEAACTLSGTFIRPIRTTARGDTP